MMLVTSLRVTVTDRLLTKCPACGGNIMLMDDGAVECLLCARPVRLGPRATADPKQPR
jgi:hypothetical protein